MPEDEPAPTASRWRFHFHLGVPAVFTLVILVLVLSGVVTARGWPDQARLFPVVVGLAAVGMCAAQLFLDLFRVSQGGSARIMDLEAERGVPGKLVARRAADIFGWILGLLASIWSIGFLLSVPLFMWLYLALRAGAGWRLCLGYTALALAVLLGVFPLHAQHPLAPGRGGRSAGNPAAVAGGLGQPLLRYQHGAEAPLPSFPLSRE